MTATDNSSTPLHPDGWIVAALYQFHEVADPAALQQQLQALVADCGLCGTLIVAHEGINGTVAGSREGIDRLRTFLQHFGFLRLEYKESHSPDKPFGKMKVKLKREIVTLGVDVKPRDLVGHYCTPQEWNDLISRDDVLVIDTRNDYEYKAGTFRGAIDPQTETFREFPEFVRDQLAEHKDKKIAMFCTGGIRCEKSTSLLLQEGFSEVYHLKGGILKYLEDVPPEQSLWQGECFVFDGRTAVTHGVQVGQQQKCHACGWPVTPEEAALPSFEAGVSCVHCIDKTTEQQKAGFRMRQQQLQAAKSS